MAYTSVLEADSLNGLQVQVLSPGLGGESKKNKILVRLVVE
jgi:hypothetical protein